MSDWQLKQLIARQPGYPDTRPTVSLSHDDEARPARPEGLSGTVLPPEGNYSPHPTQTAMGGAPTINGEYRKGDPMIGFPPPKPDDPDMDM